MMDRRTERERQIAQIRADMDNDNDWFFEQFGQGSKKVAKRFGLVWLVLILVNLLFWIAVIAFGAWAIGYWVV